MGVIGVVGLGDMGSGLAKNLIAASYEVRGYDLAAARMDAFAAMGGVPAASASDAGAGAEAVFVMVLNGTQAAEVILGTDGSGGLRGAMPAGGAALLTATVRPAEARAIGAALEDGPIELIDTPVSGGFPGAQGGTLTMMAAGSDAALARARGPMEAVSATIHRVGTRPGDGQTVKACLQSLIGSIFAATFEASVLAAKAGVPGEVLQRVIATSGAGCGVANTALSNIVERRFEGTGSRIDTMHKDLTIVMDLARELGVPLFTASTAMNLFEAGRTRYPQGDNWVVTRVLEEIVGAGLERGQ